MTDIDDPYELRAPREHARLKGSVENWNWISFDEEASALIMVAHHHAWLVSYPSLEVLSSLQHEDYFAEVGVLGDRKYAVAAENDGIELLDASQSPQMSLQHVSGEDSVLTLAVSSDKKTIYTAGHEGFLTCWSYPGLNCLWDMELSDCITRISLSADDNRLCIGDLAGTIKIFDCDSKNVIHELNYSHKILATSLHPHQPIVLFGATSGFFASYNFETGDEGYSHAPFACCPVGYSPDGSIGVASATNGLIYVWNVELNSLLFYFEIPEYHGEGFPFCFTPDSKYLITGGAPPNALHVWDLTQPSPGDHF